MEDSTSSEKASIRDSEESSHLSTTHSSEIVEDVWEPITVAPDTSNKKKKVKQKKRAKPKVQDKPDIRRSLEALVENPENQEAIEHVSTLEDTLVKPEAISRGHQFDKSIRAALTMTGDLITKVLVPRQNRRGRLTKEERIKARKKAERSRARLRVRVERSNLAEFQIRGNGNCQFSSLSDQLYRTTALSGVIRKLVVKHLRAHPDMYSPYVASKYKRYCKRMGKSGCWGDHITLKAAADLFGVEINLLTSYKENAILKIEPQERRTDKIVWMSFMAELHYNSLYTTSDLEKRQAMDELDGSDKRMKALLQKHEDIEREIEEGQDKHSILQKSRNCAVM